MFAFWGVGCLLCLLCLIVVSCILVTWLGFVLMLVLLLVGFEFLVLYVLIYCVNSSVPICALFVVLLLALFEF